MCNSGGRYIIIQVCRIEKEVEIFLIVIFCIINITYILLRVNKKAKDRIS